MPLDARVSSDLARFFEFSFDLLCTADFDGCLIELNSAWTRTLGFKAHELENRPLLDFVHPDDRAATASEIKHLRQGEETRCFESRFRSKSGEYRWLSWTAHGVVADGRIYAVARDVHAQKVADTEREGLRERFYLAQKLEGLAILAGGVAHDFNNLLVGVVGHADIALNEMDPSAIGYAELENIKATGERASELCRQMLAYAGRGQLEIETIDISELVRGIVGLLEINCGNATVLESRLSDGLAHVNVDASQIRQVVMNLITNAADAIGDEDGVIFATTGAESVSEANEPDISGTVLARGEYVYVEVADTGCGMDSDTILRMFEPYFSTKSDSRGLGLASTLRIVRSHGGGVRVDSQVGTGTKIRILLPVTDDQAPIAADAEKDSQWTGSGTILLVDDDAIVRAVATRMLERHGLEVVGAADGREAVDIFTERPDRFDLVLLDLTMPRLDGRKAAHELHRIDPNVRIIASSGYCEQAISAGFRSEELRGFVQKPFDERTLIAKVRRVLEE